MVKHRSHGMRCRASGCGQLKVLGMRGSSLRVVSTDPKPDRQLRCVTGSYRPTALSQAEPSRVCSHSGICGCRAGCRAAEMAGEVRSRSRGVDIRADGADRVARSSLPRPRKRGGKRGRQAALLSTHSACRRGLDCVGCRASGWSLVEEPGGPSSSPCTYATDLTARGSLRCAGGNRGTIVLAGPPLRGSIGGQTVFDSRSSAREIGLPSAGRWLQPSSIHQMEPYSYFLQILLACG